MTHTPYLPPELQQALYLAQQYVQGGHPAEAEVIYRQLLERYPDHPEPLHRLGGLLLQSGQAVSALPLLERARHVAPGNGETWLLLTQCLLALDRPKEAKKVISEVMRLGLKHPLADELLRQARVGHKKKSDRPQSLNDALRQLDALFRAGRYIEAEEGARRLIKAHPKAEQAWYFLGMARLMQKHWEDAIEPFQRAVAIKPNFAEAQFNLGYALEQAGRLDGAVVAYDSALAAAPNLAEAHNNRGNVLRKLKRPEEALDAYGKALALRPKSAEYQVNLGNALGDLDRLEEAVDAYEAALKLQPDSIQACRNMGHALKRLERYAKSVEAYRRVVELSPNEPGAYQALGTALHLVARLEEANMVLQRALELKPDSDTTINMLAGVLADMGREEETLNLYRQGLAIDPDGMPATHSNLLLSLNYQEQYAVDVVLEEARNYGHKMARRAKPFSAFNNAPVQERQLRVGLVSGDFGEHPVGYFLLNVLECFDQQNIKLCAYETAKRKDRINNRLHEVISHWRVVELEDMDDKNLAHQIFDDGIDILIDLAGHTGHNRLPVFAWKPAPVQVTWLGYFATTGLSAIDWILSDRWVLPETEEAHFIEKPWRLPDAYYCFTPPEFPLTVGHLPAAGCGQVTFGCFNNPRKLNDRVFACWSRVMAAVPGSTLLLKNKAYENATVREEITDRFARLGVDSGRLRFAGQSPRAEYLAAYNEVDIALDPFPFPGGTTSIEGLWMGVPVLTLKGDRFISHQGETILQNVGLPEWIAQDVDDYVAKAAAFAADLPALTRLRAGLREQLLASPLCDAPRFARNLEQAFRGMWQIWCAQQATG